MESSLSKSSLLILNNKPEESTVLTKICNLVGTAFSTTETGSALELLKNKRIHVLLIDSSMADYSHFKSLPSSTSIIITDYDQDDIIIKLSKQWPLVYYVDTHMVPKNKEEANSFLRTLKTAMDHAHLKLSLKQKKEKLREALTEIQEIKTVINDSVVKEIEDRLSLQSRFILFRQEKQKMERILKKLYAANDITSLIDIIHDVKDILHAQGISIYLVEESQALGKYLKPLVWNDSILSHPEMVKYTIPLGKHDFAAITARDGTVINSSEAFQDPRLTQRYIDQLGYRLENILCVPILAEESVIGVIEVYNKYSHQTREKKVFSQEDHRILGLISEHVSIAITKLNLIQYDALTGLLRPDPFFEKIIQKIKLDGMRRQEDSAYAIVMGDVDWFKNYNDRNGHEAGNKLLRQLSLVMKSSIREEDLLCRYGGEEFLFFLAKIEDIKDACRLTERIRQRIEEHYFENEENQPRSNLTMSFGVTAFTKTRLDSLETLSKVDLIKIVNEADMALAEAKQKRVASSTHDDRAERMIEKNKVCAFYQLSDQKFEKIDGIKPYHERYASEKREHKRFYTSTLLVYKNSHGPQVTKTINLSLGGLKIPTTDQFMNYQTLDLILILGNRVCQMQGEIVYSSKTKNNGSLFHTGLQFKNVSLDNKKVLEEYFSSLHAGSSKTAH